MQGHQLRLDTCRDFGCRSFTDAGLNDTHTCTVNWDDGQGPLRYSATETAGSDHCKQKSYSAAGVYTIDGTTLDGAAVGPDGAVYTKDTASGRVLRWRAADGLSIVAGTPQVFLTGDRTGEENPEWGSVGAGEGPVPADRVSLEATLGGAYLAFLPSGDLAMTNGDQVLVLGDPAALPGR